MNDRKLMQESQGIKNNKKPKFLGQTKIFGGVYGGRKSEEI